MTDMCCSPCFVAVARRISLAAGGRDDGVAAIYRNNCVFLGVCVLVGLHEGHRWMPDLVKIMLSCHLCLAV